MYELAKAIGLATRYDGLERAWFEHCMQWAGVGEEADVVYERMREPETQPDMWRAIRAARLRTRWSITAYVTSYELHQCYGGPEEGGWWYDAGHMFERRVAGDLRELALILDEMHTKCDRLTYGNIHSTKGGRAFEVRFQFDEPGPLRFPERGPRFE